MKVLVMPRKRLLQSYTSIQTKNLLGQTKVFQHILKDPGQTQTKFTVTEAGYSLEILYIQYREVILSKLQTELRKFSFIFWLVNHDQLAWECQKCI